MSTRQIQIKNIFLILLFISFNLFPFITNVNGEKITASIDIEEIQLTSYKMGFFEKNMLDKANKLYEQKKYNDALIAYQELRDKYIDNPIAWYGMGAAYYALGIYDLAIDKFDTAIKLDPNFYQAMKWLGNSYMKKGNKSEANRYLKMAEDVLKKNKTK